MTGNEFSGVSSIGFYYDMARFPKRFGPDDFFPMVGSPVHDRMSTSICGLYLQDASRKLHPITTPKMSPDVSNWLRTIDDKRTPHN